MSLQQQLDDFKSWCRRHAAPGFMKYAEDTYYNEDDGVAYSDELYHYAEEMKDAVKLNDPEYFTEIKNRYYEVFRQGNENICRDLYDEILEDLSQDTSLTIEEAGKIAVERAWSYGHMKYWLPIYALLKDDQGKEVCLVSRECHSPKGKYYVTISELSELKGKTAAQAWKYVRDRGVAA